MQNEKVTQHRLGIARSALKSIINYVPEYPWEDDWECISTLRLFAEEALKDMERHVDTKRKRREHDRDVWVARLAREVKEEVPE